MEKKEAKRPAFFIAGDATVLHLNVRKEGPDDDKILAVDIKLEVHKVDKKICGFFDDALESFLWRSETTAMIARSIYLQPVKYCNEIHGALVTIDGDRYPGAEIKKFAFDPRDGGVLNIICSVTVYPASDDVSHLARLVQDDTKICIEGPRDLFDEPPMPEVTESLKKLDKLAKEDNTTITILMPDGNVYGPLGATKSADPLIPEAIAACIEAGRASVTLLREKLGVGYTRAARIIDSLESAGKVGRMNATGVREVLATA